MECFSDIIYEHHIQKATDYNLKVLMIMNYAFYISGKSGRLKKFLMTANKRFLSNIKLVISDFEIEPELYEALKTLHIVSQVFDYSELGSNSKEKRLELSNRILDTFTLHEIDYCFSFGSHLLSGNLLEHYKDRIINFHPSVLPMFPGLRSIDQAVSHGNIFLIGNTVHFIDSGVDTGPVIMQSVIPTKAFTDTNNYDIVLDLQIEMLKKMIYILDKDMLNVIDGNVVIKCADYHKSAFFPDIEIKLE